MWKSARKEGRIEGRSRHQVFKERHRGLTEKRRDVDLKGKKNGSNKEEYKERREAQKGDPRSRGAMLAKTISERKVTQTKHHKMSERVNRKKAELRRNALNKLASKIDDGHDD